MTRSRDFCSLVPRGWRSSCGATEFRRCPPDLAILDTGPSLYRDVEDLYQDPPDALVVTGTEPVMSELTDERYWADLATLLNWAEATVPSTWLSCLAAHGALRALDQTDRVRLPVKRSGVFPPSGEPVASSRSGTRCHGRRPSLPMERGAGWMRDVLSGTKS